MRAMNRRCRQPAGTRHSSGTARAGPPTARGNPRPTAAGGGGFPGAKSGRNGDRARAGTPCHRQDRAAHRRSGPADRPEIRRADAAPRPRRPGTGGPAARQRPRPIPAPAAPDRTNPIPPGSKATRNWRPEPGPEAGRSGPPAARFSGAGCGRRIPHGPKRPPPAPPHRFPPRPPGTGRGRQPARASAAGQAGSPGRRPPAPPRGPVRAPPRRDSPDEPPGRYPARAGPVPSRATLQA